MEDRYLAKESIVLGDMHRMQNTLDYWWSHTNTKVYEEVKSYFHGRICDVGCNIGMMTTYLARYDNVSHVVGVDLLPNAIAAAIEYAKYADLYNKVSFQTFNFVQDEIPLDKESFDGVVSFHTLEHIYLEDVGTFIRHIYDMLVAGGKVFVSIPNNHWIGSPEHVSFFTRSSLSRAFRKGGFNTIRTWVCDCYDTQEGILAILNGLFEKKG